MEALIHYASTRGLERAGGKSKQDPDPFSATLFGHARRCRYPLVELWCHDEQSLRLAYPLLGSMIGFSFMILCTRDSVALSVRAPVRDALDAKRREEQRNDHQLANKRPPTHSGPFYQTDETTRNAHIGRSSTRRTSIKTATAPATGSFFFGEQPVI